MYYKYKKIVTKGANGTTIRHTSTDDVPIVMVGDIGDYTYIYANSIENQNPALVFIPVSLSTDELAELRRQRFLKDDTDTIKAAIVSSSVQDMLDKSSISRGYDSIISECSYATSTGVFGIEAQKTVDWRDAVWQKVFEIQAQVETGDIEEPTIDELLEMLPGREDDE